MSLFRSPLTLFAVGALALGLAACSKSEAPAAKVAAPAPVAIAAPAGTYALDPYHSSISFELNHLGLSTYVARFTRYQATLKLDPANMAASSVSATIEPASVRTDFSGDYKATHKESPYQTWDEDLAQSPKFLNAGQFPQITFQSTQVQAAGPGKFKIVGDLGFLGQTQPVTLEATVVGSVAAHPFTQKGALGFSAVGRIKRSAFGMTHLLQPLLVGDEVTIRFEGEFHQAVTPAG